MNDQLSKYKLLRERRTNLHLRNGIWIKVGSNLCDTQATFKCNFNILYGICDRKFYIKYQKKFITNIFIIIQKMKV